MPFSCSLCSHSQEYLYINRYCSKCQKIKHYLNLYQDRVYEILDNVLSRDLDKQSNKIKVEIHEEIKNQEFKLKKAKENVAIGEDGYDKPKTRSTLKC